MIASPLLLLKGKIGREALPEEGPELNKPLAFFIGLIAGSLQGMIGMGGAILYIPIMVYLLRISFRQALGSAVTISLISGLAGLVGKWATAQIPMLPALAVTLGATMGSLLGSRFTARVEESALRVMLALLIAAVASKRPIGCRRKRMEACIGWMPGLQRLRPVFWPVLRLITGSALVPDRRECRRYPRCPPRGGPDPG